MMKSAAYGGVLINGDGQVLLRRVANGYDGMVWSFGKGRPEPGESAEETALREVQEETGWKAEIIRRLPGEFLGGSSVNTYFLMRPVEDTGDFGKETSEVRWVSPEEARELLALNTHPDSGPRDLEVLGVALG